MPVLLRMIFFFFEEEYQKIGSDKKQSFTKNNKNKGIGKRVIILQKSRRDNTEYTDQKNLHADIRAEKTMA